MEGTWYVHTTCGVLTVSQLTLVDIDVARGPRPCLRAVAREGPDCVLARAPVLAGVCGVALVYVHAGLSSVSCVTYTKLQLL